jgi:hypothetical protein
MQSFWPFDLFARFNQLTCTDLSSVPLIQETQPLQISIRDSGTIKYKFVCGNEKTIKFYNGEDFVQEFKNVGVILDWIKHFIHLSDKYQMVWHREGEKGISAPYNESSFIKLLKLLISDDML